KLVLSWGKLYELIESPDHEGLVSILSIPQPCRLQAVLDCSGTVIDENFTIKIDDWIERGERTQLEALNGAVAHISGKPRLLPAAMWHLLHAIDSFNSRSNDKRTPHHHELAWGKIR